MWRKPFILFCLTLGLPAPPISRHARSDVRAAGLNMVVSSRLLAQEPPSATCENATLDDAAQELEVRQWDLAIEALRKAASSCSGDARYHALLAVALMNKGSSVEAAREYYAAIALSPRESDYYRALAEILIQHRAYGNARVLLEDANRKFPDDAWTYLMLGEVYRTFSSFDEAKNALDKAVARWPDNPAAHALLGNILVDSAPSEALAEYRTAIKFAPAVPQSYLFYGIALEKVNQTKEAIDAFTKCLTLAPNMANPHYYLGQIYLKQGNIQNSITELTKVLQLDPTYALAYFQMGNAYRKLGDKAKADTYLSRFGELSTAQKAQEVSAGKTFTEALAKPQQ